MDKSTNTPQPSDTNENQIKDKTSIGVVLQRNDSPHALPHNPTGEKKEKPPHDRFASIIAFIALLVAIVSAGFTYWQAIIAKDTAQKQLRAYLGIGSGGMLWRQQPDGKITLDFKIINYGQTPTSNVKIKGSIQALPTKLSETFRPEYKFFISPEPSLVVFPNAPISGIIRSDDIIQTVEFKRYVAFQSDVRIHAFVSITYNDIFDVQRHTYYCAYLIPISSTVKYGDKAGWMWSISERFNSYD